MSENKLTIKEKSGVLERFMKEFFPFNELLKVGFFTKEMRKDYKAQSDKVCKYFGYSTVYEYGAKEITCHISSTPPTEQFITVIPSIYE